MLPVIKYILDLTPSITDVTGSRIYPFVREEETEMPAIMLDIAGIDSVSSSGGHACVDRYDVTLQIYAQTAAQANSLLMAARSALNGQVGEYSIDGILYNVAHLSIAGMSQGQSSQGRVYTGTMEIEAHLALDGGSYTPVPVPDRVGGASLDDLSDVSVPSPGSGNVLKFDGGKWIAGTVSGSGSFFVSESITSVSTLPYTVLTADVLILVAPASGTITLPDPAVLTPGQGFVIKDVSGSATLATVIDTVSGSIDGYSDITLSTPYSAMTIISDGTNYFII